MYAKCVKRILDFFLSLIALLLLSPLLLALTVIGAIEMKGNPFFVQRRVGQIDKKMGKETFFSMLKFRSMKDSKDQNGQLLPDQERLTRYGRFLRKTSLDELPQLLNIIRGDLSFCGPRPLVLEYLKDMLLMEMRNIKEQNLDLTSYVYELSEKIDKNGK